MIKCELFWHILNLKSVHEQHLANLKGYKWPTKLAHMSYESFCIFCFRLSRWKFRPLPNDIDCFRFSFIQKRISIHVYILSVFIPQYGFIMKTSIMWYNNWSRRKKMTTLCNFNSIGACILRLVCVGNIVNGNVMACLNTESLGVALFGSTK